MKIKSILPVIALLGLATILSCSKGSVYKMKATISTGTNYSVNNCTISTTAGTTIIEGLTDASAAEPTLPYISIWIENWDGSSTGTFSFDSTLTTNYAEYVNKPTDIRISKTGSVVITSVSSTAVSGTFSFTSIDGTVISGGSFTAKRI